MNLKIRWIIDNNQTRFICCSLCYCHSVYIVCIAFTLIFNLYQFSDEFLTTKKNRTFARLGEYDTSSFTDGKHEDIDIEKRIPHENWSLDLLKNDIAVLKLVRDVTFNGNKISNEIFIKFRIVFVIMTMIVFSLLFV